MFYRFLLLRRFPRLLSASVPPALWMTGALCAALLPLKTLSQEAEIRHYEIEMIVFASNDPSAAEGESWAPPTDLRYPDPLQRMRPPVAEDGEEQTHQEPLQVPAPLLLDPLEGGIGELAEILVNTERYRILLQWRWVQPLAVGSETPHILVQGGGQHGAHRELEGFVRLRHRRYLHLETDLWLSSYGTPGQKSEAPLPPPAPPAWAADSSALERKAWQIAESLDRQALKEQPPVLRTVRLKQTRRMRSQELHYLDHPLFGLLIKLTPVEGPPPQPAP